MILPYLYKRRVKARIGTYGWLKLWGKRVFTLPELVSLEWQRAKFRMAGVKLGPLADLQGARLIGPGHRLSIGAGTFVGRVEIQLLADVEIGRDVVVNDGVSILTGSHDVESPVFESQRKSVKIGDCAWICTSALILPGVSIGEAAVVAAGAVVTKDVPPGEIVAGNPARALKRRSLRRLACSPNLLRASYEAWIGNVSEPPR